MRKLKRLMGLLTVLSVCLGGCSYSVEINDKAYVLAIGFDEGSDNMLKVSFLFAYPTGGSGEESGGEKTKEKDIVTVEAPTLYSAMRLLDTFKSKEIDTAHTKLIVFSEKMARSKGIDSQITDLVNTRGFRPSIYLCVSQTAPDRLFESMEPKQDIFIEKYIEHLFSKVAKSGKSVVYLYNHYFGRSEGHKGYLLPLIGITDRFEAKKAKDSETDKKSDDFTANYTAKEIPIDGSGVPALSGYGVFTGKKMTHTLGLEESEIVRILGSELSYGQFCVLWPDENIYVNVLLRQPDPTEIMVSTGEKASIKVNIKLKGEFTGVGDTIRSELEYRAFMDYLEDAFTQKTRELLLRTQQQFETDVLGLGDYAKKTFLTNSQWESYDWKEKYKTADIEVYVNVDIDHYGELKKSSTF